MQMEIITRHFNLGEEQTETIEAVFEKLVKFSPRPVQSTKLTIVHEAGIFTADSVLHLRNHEFRAKGEGREPEIAVNELSENLRKQLAKFKGKISGKQRGEEGGLGHALMADGLSGEGDTLSAEGFILRDMGVDDAKAAFQSGSQPFLVFRNVANNQVGIIYRRGNGDLGLMESTN